MDSLARLDALRSMVESALHDIGDGFGEGRLADAMRYALLGGGKRVRPLLVLAAIDHAGINPAPYATMACAVELVHAYSLVHDDLPAMDDDALRRGRATTHIAFDEATAILAGDALLTDAFSLLAGCDALDTTKRSEAVRMLAQASGSCGMVKGQMLDLMHENTPLDAATLETIQTLKTGELMAVSLALGALVANAPVADWETLGHLLGLSFQIQDDLLEVKSDERTTGKTLSDANRKKSTMVSLHGEEKTQALLNETYVKVDATLKKLNVKDGALIVLIDTLKERRK